MDFDPTTRTADLVLDDDTPLAAAERQAPAPVLIVPVILAGDTGSALWPVARESLPLPVCPLDPQHTPLQHAALRAVGPLSGGLRFAPPIVLCGQEHRFLVAAQLDAAGIAERRVLLEPVGAGAAAAMAAAVLLLAEEDPRALILLLSANGMAADAASLQAALPDAATAAHAGQVVALGTASACMRLCTAGVLIEALRSAAPALLDCAANAVAGRRQERDVIRLGNACFDGCTGIGLDELLVSHLALSTADGAAAPPGWGALWQGMPKDAAGNVAAGDALLIGSSDCYVRGDGILTAVIGLKDAVVVATEDAVLAMHRDHAGDVEQVVQRLSRSGRREAVSHNRGHRPWGYYETLALQHRFQVKRIVVEPGQKLSLQKHFHRAEHWVVVQGSALVVRDDEQRLLSENESIYLPLGCVHRLENPGRIPLVLIEVQVGAYLGEDDIVRIEDIYARA